MLAKLVANFVRFLKITGLSSIALVLLALEGRLLNPAVWTSSALSGVAEAAVKLYLLAIAVSPASITLGMFLGLMLRSRLKPFAPFLLAFVISAFLAASNFVVQIFGSVIKVATLTSVPPIPLFLSPTYLGVAGQLAIAALLLGASTYILAEQIEV